MAVLLPQLPAWAEPPLNHPTVAVWPLASIDEASRHLAHLADPMLVDTLRDSGSFGTIEREPMPNSRAPERVIDIGSRTGAVLLMTGSVVASGDRATVTLTVQDTVSGAVLNVDSLSGPAADTPELISQLGHRLVKRWQDGQLQPSVVEWRDGTAALRLDTVPKGAITTLDGKPVGVTPVLVRGLAAGEHRVEAVVREAVTVDTIDLITAPPGLQLRFNDRDVTFAPLTVSNQTEGQHKVAILGDTPPRQFGIHVLSTPAGAVVRWDGQQIGETPLTTAVQPKLGNHELTIVGRALLGAEETVTVADGARQDVTIPLAPFAKIIVTSQPPEADVQLDGRPVGATPISVAVKAGEHVVTVNKRTYVPESRTLTLTAGGVADVQTTLLPARQTDGTVIAVPTGEVAAGLAMTPFLLGFGRSAQGRTTSWLGLTATYGWPQLVSIGNFPIGLAVGAATMRADGDRTALWTGGGVKLQVLQQGDEWPVSASLGAWGQGIDAPYWQGYAALSRQIGDFTVHLGVATGGLSISANYHRLPHWILGGVAYLDYGMLQTVGAGSVPMFGLRAGYVL
jgi:TolB-like protein